MVRRRQKESVLGLFLAAPWWMSAIMAIGGFVVFQWIIPADTANNPILKTAGQIAKPFGYFFGVIFGLIALVNFFRQRTSTATSASTWQPAKEKTTTSISTRILHDDGVSKAWDDLMAKPRKPEAKPTGWSVNLLQRIDWKRFEELCAAFYRETGLRSETIHCGADGGVDAKLFQGDATDAMAIVQCKAWNSRRVGVKPVRELLGVMTHQGVEKGIFIATGDFTNEAIEFAKTNPLDLISGMDFMAMIRQLPAEGQRRLLAVATEGEFTTPTCPSCGIKMIWRKSDRRDFWGCNNFPRCRQTFFVRAENT